MNSNTLEQKKISKAINNAISSGFNIDLTGDEDFLKSSNYSWDDLNTLKTELCNKVMEFIGQVNSVIIEPDVIKNLGDKQKHFEKTVAVFYADLEEFSKNIKGVIEQHENKTGHIDNINDFNLYNRLAIQYQSLFYELTTLVSPTLSELMLIISEIITVDVSNTVSEPNLEKDKTNE